MARGFIKRLGWYLVGFSIGLVFLIFIVKKKSGEEGIDFCYLPNCRVLKDIRSKPMFMYNKTIDTLQFVDLEDGLKYFLTEGNIDFGKSDTKSEPCKTYRIHHPDKTEVLEVQNCSDKVLLGRIVNTYN